MARAVREPAPAGPAVPRRCHRRNTPDRAFRSYLRMAAPRWIFPMQTLALAAHAAASVATPATLRPARWLLPARTWQPTAGVLLLAAQRPVQQRPQRRRAASGRPDG